MASGAPSYDAVSQIVTLLIQATVAAILLSILVGVIAAFASKKSFWEALVFVMPFGWLGTVSGLIAGSTKEAIVGALLTGMLTIVGAMLSYTFSRESLVQWRTLLPFAVILLSVGVLGGLSIGQYDRTADEKFDRDYAEWLMLHEKVDLPAMAVRVRYKDCVKYIAKASQPKCEALLLK